MQAEAIDKKRWRLWQVETALACNLNCVMCPWKDFRRQAKSGLMGEAVWEGLRPHLSQVLSVDFTGGGEPLLHPLLTQWLTEAKTAGCQTGFLSNGVLLDKKKAAEIVGAGVDWVAVSVDGAEAESYEQIRRGADFRQICENLTGLKPLRVEGRPMLMLNFVIMPRNANELESIVKLAGALGADQVNFKNCDVVRSGHGKGLGLFGAEKTVETRRLDKGMAKAQKLARKLKIKTTAFSFTPDEQPVCDQDPRDSLFIRHDGAVAPCINLARGGASTFLDRSVVIPTVHFGSVPQQDLMDIWENDASVFYRNRFHHRVRAYNAALISSSFESSLSKFKETLEVGLGAMPAAPQGCDVCHYLYGI